MRAKRNRPSPFADFIGAQLEEMAEGCVRLLLVIGPQHTNSHGVMHGGVVTSLMDSALGAALWSLRGEEAGRRPHATVAMNASFFAVARPGDEIGIEGRVVRFGRAIAFGAAEARRKTDGEVIATAGLTFAISDSRK